MSDPFDLPESADELHDDLPVALPVITPDAALLAEEQAEDDFDFEFADEWEPMVAASEVVESVDEDGAVKFVVEIPADLD
jgi:hypothetical protein